MKSYIMQRDACEENYIKSQGKYVKNSKWLVPELKIDLFASLGSL